VATRPAKRTTEDRRQSTGAVRVRWGRSLCHLSSVIWRLNWSTLFQAWVTTRRLLSSVV